MINLNNYIERIIGMFLQYRFAIEAMDRLHDDDSALPEYIEWESKSITELLGYLRSFPGVVKTRYLSADIQELSQYWSNKLPNDIGKAYTAINQNFIIMGLALFESFLKDVHRAILFKEPKLLPANKKIHLGKLVDSGYKKIIKEEIDRKVASLDRISIQNRAKYFAEDLKIRWSDDHELIEQVSDLNDLRNRILHENPDEEVSSAKILSALLTLIIIPSTLYLHGRKKYTGIFQDIF